MFLQRAHPGASHRLHIGMVDTEAADLLASGGWEPPPPPPMRRIGAEGADGPAQRAHPRRTQGHRSTKGHAKGTSLDLSIGVVISGELSDCESGCPKEAPSESDCAAECAGLCRRIGKSRLAKETLGLWESE